MAAFEPDFGAFCAGLHACNAAMTLVLGYPNSVAGEPSNRRCAAVKAINE
jgi:hypothetical protein